MIASHALATPSSPWEPDGVTITLRPGRGRDEPPAWLAIPQRRRPNARPLVAVHGIARTAEVQAHAFARPAAALGRPVIAPLFDSETFPRYQLAVDQQRTDLALLSLLDALSREQLCDVSKFDLFGFSGGAQFAHRFAWLYPHRVRRLIVTAAGWYTFPDDEPFPYGLGPPVGPVFGFGRLFEANLQDFLRLQTKVVVGALDNVVDGNTRAGPRINAQQGRDRVTRARRWALSLRARAVALGFEPRATFEVLARCGHDFGDCVRVGRLDRIVLATEDLADNRAAS